MEINEDGEASARGVVFITIKEVNITFLGFLFGASFLHQSLSLI